MAWVVWANLQELQNLPEEDSYLFHNYPWKKHPAFENVMEYSEEEYTEAAALYHELWKLHLLSLKRNWA